MTTEEKRDLLEKYCARTDCQGCVLDNKTWDKPLCLVGKDCPDIAEATERDLDKALALINVSKTENPYWDNITKIAEKQRAKGMETYGQGLEDNDKPALERITYIEEELVDALMYLEWLKEKVKDGR